MMSLLNGALGFFLIHELQRFRTYDAGRFESRSHTERGELPAVSLKIRALGSGAKDTRSPDASRLPDALKLRKASGVRRVHRRF